MNKVNFIDEWIISSLAVIAPSKKAKVSLDHGGGLYKSDFLSIKFESAAHTLNQHLNISES